MESNGRRVCGEFGYGGGFTLMEVLVSIAVIATAATVFVSLFGSSLILSRQNRSQSVAASLAEEQLDAILRNSQDFVWNLNGAEPGQLVEVSPADSGGAGAEELGRAFEALGVLPVEPGSSAREENFYGKFRWQAYVAVPEPDAKHVNVTVVVRWTDSGRQKSVAVTSSAPRFALGGRPMASAVGAGVEAGGMA